MVYLIVVYDVEADRTRLFRDYLRRFLYHVQNSVFEGEVTEGDAEKIEAHLEELLNAGESTICYRFGSESMVTRTALGEDPADDARFL